jgi:hypothetical protein
MEAICELHFHFIDGCIFNHSFIISVMSDEQVGQTKHWQSFASHGPFTMNYQLAIKLTA